MSPLVLLFHPSPSPSRSHLTATLEKKTLLLLCVLPFRAIHLQRPQYIGGGGAAALEKPTVIKAPQPRVGDIAILLVTMRRGIASRAVHGGNPRHSAVLSENKSSVYRRGTSSGSDME